MEGMPCIIPLTHSRERGQSMSEGCCRENAHGLKNIAFPAAVGSYKHIDLAKINCDIRYGLEVFNCNGVDHKRFSLQ